MESYFMYSFAFDYFMQSNVCGETLIVACAIRLFHFIAEYYSTV